ncbi:MAG TPA: hypothetical protein VNH38_00430 [Candidatus Dormibacteraeota bacterium]|nr:hypothetical protein [Candidatus Dormibacteraeota bacterium]
MPHGSDPRRRPDQQSPDSGASVPPTWWSALSDGRLPTEGVRAQQSTKWGDRLQRLALRLSAPVVVLAVVGAVVAAGFGYRLVGVIVGVVLLVGLGVVTLVHHRRAADTGDSGWWR